MKKIILIISGLFLISRLRASNSVPSIPSGPSTGDGSGSTSGESFLGRADLPRGIRNNNPGNIRINNGNDWKGKISSNDPAFEQFETYAYGVRAMIVLIRNSYIIRDGKDTLTLIIQRYAPASENNTQKYIDHVSRLTGIGPHTTISTDYNTIYRVVSAMAVHENGIPSISPIQFERAWNLI